MTEFYSLRARYERLKPLKKIGDVEKKAAAFDSLIETLDQFFFVSQDLGKVSWQTIKGVKFFPMPLDVSHSMNKVLQKQGLLIFLEDRSRGCICFEGPDVEASFERCPAHGRTS